MAFGGKAYNGGDGIDRSKYAGKEPGMFWPTSETGLPVRVPPGADQSLLKNELEDLQTCLDFKSKMFLLWKEEDKREFDAVHDKCANRVFRIMNRRDEWDDEQKHLRVWLEWLELYKTLKKA